MFSGQPRTVGSLSETQMRSDSAFKGRVACLGLGSVPVCVTHFVEFHLTKEDLGNQLESLLRRHFVHSRLGRAFKAQMRRWGRRNII